jgi:hypothetical protein
MKLRLSLTMAIFLVAVSVLGADAASFKIEKPFKAPRVAKGTGVQGTITIGALPAQLQQLSCTDISVHVGILHAGGQAMTSMASSRATGTLSSGQCSYHVNSRLPAGGPFDVVIVADPASAACTLGDTTSFGKVTLTRGSTSELNLQLTPACAASGQQ